MTNSSSDNENAGTFDYIVVGAGSAGCALAARLTEDPTVSVLLLEAGGKGRHPWIQLPIGYGKVFYDRRFNWSYTTEADPGLGGRTMYWPRGKTLGGSSAINALVFVRGHPQDYEAWGRVAPGWSWSDVEPVFRRMESWTGDPIPERGKDGPITITDVSKALHPLTRVCLEASEEAGFPRNPDYNAGSMSGVGPYQINTHRGVRASTAAAYLDPAKSRANLKVQTSALATRIEFDGHRATGVSYQVGNQLITARAQRDVILSAGALNTPQLLQLSGIGPPDVLKTVGVEVLLASPHVGRNLSDHLSMDLLYGTKVPSLNQTLRPWTGKCRSALQYLLTRTGPLSMSLNQAGGFVRVDKKDGPPDLQLYISPLSYSRAPEGTRPLLSPDPFPAVRFGFGQCKPTSTGYMEIVSPDPRDAPRFTPNYLSTDLDRRMMVAGVRLVRQIASMPALASVIECERIPGSNVETDADLLDFVRADSWTTFHQSGTCRMGPSIETSVVDARLRVHGTRGLRIADASIFPEIPTGNTNAPAIMVGEMASDIIRADSEG